MTSLSTMTTQCHTLIVITDIGRADPDDAAMANYLVAYMESTRNIFEDIVFVCVGGDDTVQNAKILAKCLEATTRDDVMSLDDTYLVLGKPTKGGHELEYGADWDGPYNRMMSLESRVTGKISVLVAGPPVGIDFDDFIDWEGSKLHACVFVGEKPSTNSRGVNGGGTLTAEEDRSEILANITILEDKLGDTGMIFLPPSFTRAQPITVQNLAMYKNPVLTELYIDVTTKYLLMDRPVHLPPAIQLRIANANLTSLMAICDAWQHTEDAVTHADSINDPAFIKAGLLYSQRSDFGDKGDLSIMDIPEMDDTAKGKMRSELAEVTAQIFTCQAFINTLCFTTEAAKTPMKGLARYLDKVPPEVDMPLMPYYDGIGGAVICMMSRDSSDGLFYKTFENAFSTSKCPENERYPMTVMQHMIHFELSKF